MNHFHQIPATQTELNFHFNMHQSLYALELPITELAEWVKEEINKNPLLEYTEKDLDVKGHFLIDHAPNPPQSLFEHLIEQLRELDLSPLELEYAELLIGNLDEKGFLSFSLQQICSDPAIGLKVLRYIQQCDPPGIGAFNVQHCLLLQLERKGLKTSLAYLILRDHYADFLHNRLPQIASHLHQPLKKIKSCILDEIRSLHLHPGYRFKHCPTCYIHPDLIIQENSIQVNEQLIPSFTVKDLPKTQALHPYFQGANRVLEILERRKNTLEKIGKFILERQKLFFTEYQDLQPLSIRETAEALSLHESTISRAVKDKYIQTPKGLLALRDLFVSVSNSETSDLKNQIHELIQNEDKRSPYSDEALARKLKQLGLSCARRTIAKYREELSIPHSSLRRQW